MKKMLVCVALMGAMIAQAEMYFDDNTKIYFTYPCPNNVNQEEYHALAMQFDSDLEQYLKNGNDSDYTWRMAKVNAAMRLEHDNSHTAKAFKDDLAKITNLLHMARIVGAPC